MNVQKMLVLRTIARHRDETWDGISGTSSQDSSEVNAAVTKISVRTSFGKGSKTVLLW